MTEIGGNVLNVHSDQSILNASIYIAPRSDLNAAFFSKLCINIGSK